MKNESEKINYLRRALVCCAWLPVWLIGVYVLEFYALQCAVAMFAPLGAVVQIALFGYVIGYDQTLRKGRR